MIKVLIVEDETSAQEHMKGLIRALDHPMQVIGAIGTVEDTVAWFRQNGFPDLIFMDIHLSDGLSFDILEQVEVACPIIYTTAYDEYAIKAFKTTGIAYLLKPVTFEELKAAFEKYLKLTEPLKEELNLRQVDLLGQLEGGSKVYKDRFLMKKANQLTPVLAEEIAYFRRKSEVVFATTFSGDSYIHDQSLNHFQKVLDPNTFVRLNRQLLVNIKSIKHLEVFKPGQLKVILEPQLDDPIVLSQERSRWLKTILNAD